MTSSYQYDVFLSHSSKDKERVRKLAKHLQDAKLNVWFDENNIPDGGNIPLHVEEGIKASRKMILCVSKNGFGSKWVTYERSVIRMRDPSNSEISLIPLRLDNCEIPETEEVFKYIDFQKIDEAAINRVIKACFYQSANTPSPTPLPNNNSRKKDTVPPTLAPYLCDRADQWKSFRHGAGIHFQDTSHRPLVVITHGASNQCQHLLPKIFMHRMKTIEINGMEVDKWVNCLMDHRVRFDYTHRLEQDDVYTTLREGIAQVLGRKANDKDLAAGINDSKTGVFFFVELPSDYVRKNPAVLQYIFDYCEQFPNVGSNAFVVFMLGVVYEHSPLKKILPEFLFKFFDPDQKIRTICRTSVELKERKIKVLWLKEELGSICKNHLRTWEAELSTWYEINHISDDRLSKILSGKKERPFEYIIVELEKILKEFHIEKNANGN